MQPLKTQPAAPLSLEQRLFKRRLLDRSLPPGLDSGAARIYQEMLLREQLLDSRLLKKQLDIQEASFRSLRSKQRLRVYCTHSYVRQDGVYHWTCRVDARPLTDPKSRRLSAFLRSLHFEILSPEHYPTENFAEWTKVAVGAEIDGFEVKRSLRAGHDAPVSLPVRVFLSLDFGGDRFQVAPRLAALLGVGSPVEGKAQLVMALWQYVKLHRLQNAEDKRLIDCDDEMRGIFGCAQIAFGRLPELIAPHLSPVEALQIPYVVELFPEHAEYAAPRPAVFDVDFEFTDGTVGRGGRPLPSLLASTGSTREIIQLEQRMAEALSGIHRSHVRAEYLRRFSEDPSGFLTRWVASQNGDLMDILGADGATQGTLFQESGLYRQPWVQEMIAHYLAEGGSR